ncbi:MAG: NADH dehydrogenase subunit N [uncultured bacterium]|nr:MAG: NADH dehydrogenase subunit N [uncultured bacterium]
MNPIIFFIPFVVAIIYALLAKNSRVVRLSSMIFSLIGGIAVFSYAIRGFLSDAGTWSDGWWLLDGFSALMVMLIAFLYMSAVAVSYRYIMHEYEEKMITLNDLKMYFALLHLFALCMIVTVLANNVLLLWITLEGTTLSSTFLVGLYRRKTSIEAAWKYMIICSTGITLGLIGILLMSHGAHVGGVLNSNIFTLSVLMENASLINLEIVRWAFVFIFVGFGAKVGLVPMHTWLPDAHSKAPSPISAIFSGILLNVALYAIIRFKFVTDAALGDSAWTGNLFLIFGLLSVILPAFMMLVQKNYKRMLAYSSVEHMGLIVFALALYPLGALAAVMHMIGHALVKSLLFFGAGEILINWKTTNIEKVKELMKHAPYTGTLFLLGILSIIAIPPSALFISEYTMFANAISVYPKISIVLFVALAIIAYAMLKLTVTMLFSKAGGDKDEIISKRETWNITHTVMTLQLVLMVAVSFWFTTDAGVKNINSIVEDAIFISK